MDETPVFLNMNINWVVDKIGNKQINNDSPNIRKESNSLDLVKNGKIFYEINENA